MNTIKVYLVRSGGTEKEGPFSLAQINKDLAEGKYTGKDFWAWHEGLDKWMPLYSISGVEQIEETPDPSKPKDSSWRDQYFAALVKIVTGDAFLDNILQKRPALAAENRDFIGTHIACYAVWVVALFSLGPRLPNIILADKQSAANLIQQMSSVLDACHRANRFTPLREQQRIMASYVSIISDHRYPEGNARTACGLCFAATALGHDVDSRPDNARAQAKFLAMVQSGDFAAFAVEGEYIYGIIEEFHNSLMKYLYVKKLGEECGLE